MISREEEWILIILSRRRLSKVQVISALATSYKRRIVIKFFNWKFRRLINKGLITMCIRNVNGRPLTTLYFLSDRGRSMLEDLDSQRESLRTWEP